jgi:hypothetical protein
MLDCDERFGNQVFSFVFGAAIESANGGNRLANSPAAASIFYVLIKSDSLPPAHTSSRSPSRWLRVSSFAFVSAPQAVISSTRAPNWPKESSDVLRLWQQFRSKIELQTN